MVSIFIFELFDVFRSPFFRVRRIDDTCSNFDDEIPSGTQELRVAPGTADPVGVTFECTFVVADGVVGINQGRGYEVSDIPLDEPVPPARLQDNMTPLRVSEFERIHG